MEGYTPPTSWLSSLNINYNYWSNDIGMKIGKVSLMMMMMMIIIIIEQTGV